MQTTVIEYAVISLVISAKLAAALHAQLIQTQCPRSSYSENSMCIQNQVEPYVYLYNNLTQPSVGRLPSSASVQ